MPHFPHYDGTLLICCTIRRDQKKFEIPGPARTKKSLPEIFFLVDLIHASHAFVLDFHARMRAQHSTDHASRKASFLFLMPRRVLHMYIEKEYMKVMRETVSGGGIRYFAGSRYFMTPGPKLVHAIQHQIFKEKKKKFARPHQFPTMVARESRIFLVSPNLVKYVNLAQNSICVLHVAILMVWYVLLISYHLFALLDFYFYF